MHKSLLAPAAALAALALLTPPAQAVEVLLDFNGTICGALGDVACSDFARIGQNYGDVAGVLDVSHRSATLDGATLEPYLKLWTTGYSNLTNVVWGGSTQNANYAEMSFLPAAGQQVTLNSLDFGDYQNRNIGSKVSILDAVTLQTLWSVAQFDPGFSATTFTPAVSSANGLILRWGPDSFNVGADNISLSVTAVPEPGTWALLLGGAALLALRRRQRA